MNIKLETAAVDLYFVSGAGRGWVGWEIAEFEAVAARDRPNVPKPFPDTLYRTL